MSVTFGFYNSVNGDRKYDAIQMSNLFDGIINDGVFMGIGTELMVKTSTNMTIYVGTGRAWFDHTWTFNDAIIPITLEPSEVIFDRIDSVVLEVNSTQAVRANSIKLIKGTPATNPVAQALVKTEFVKQYPLAYILVKKGVTSITQADITNKVGSTDTPFVNAILEHVTAEELVEKWEVEWNQWVAATKAQNASWTATQNQEFTTWSNIKQSEFQAWFATVKGILSGDVAGNLTNRIVEIENDLSTPDHGELTSTGITSLPSTAQSAPFNELVLEGRTLTNMTTYNRDTWAEWIKTAGVVGDSTGLNLASSGTNIISSVVSKIKTSTKYGFLYNVVSSNVINNTFRFGGGFIGTGSFNDTITPSVVGNQKLIITSRAELGIRTFVQLTGVSTESIKLKDIRVFELPAGSQIESDFNTLSADQLAVIYPYIDGTQSVGEVEIKTVGKNLFDGELELGAINIVTGVDTKSETAIRTRKFIKIGPNTTYTLTNINRWYIYDDNKGFVSTDTSRTFTSPNNARYIKVINVLSEGSLDTQMQIEKGDIATPYEPYTETSTLTPPIGNSVPSIKDTFDVVSGVKTQNVGDKIIQSSDITLYDTLTNATYALLKKPLDFIGHGNINEEHYDSFMLTNYSNQNAGGIDSVSMVGKISHRGNPTNFMVGFQKGTTLAQAQTALAGTKIYYQLAQPIITRYDTEVLLSQPNGTIIPITDGIYPTMKIKYPNNTKAGITTLGKTLQQTFQSVSSGKEIVANAITDKGVVTNPTDTFATMAGNIRNIETDITGDATAMASDILLNKTAAVKGKMIVGTIPITNPTQTDRYLTPNISSRNGSLFFQVPKNTYLNGVAYVGKEDPNFSPGNIKKGVPMFGLTGTLEPKPIGGSMSVNFTNTLQTSTSPPTEGSTVHSAPRVESPVLTSIPCKSGFIYTMSDGYTEYNQIPQKDPMTSRNGGLTIGGYNMYHLVYDLGYTSFLILMMALINGNLMVLTNQSNKVFITNVGSSFGSNGLTITNSVGECYSFSSTTFTAKTALKGTIQYF